MCRATPADLDDFPGYRDKIAAMDVTPKYLRPICKGPIGAPRDLLGQDEHASRGRAPGDDEALGAGDGGNVR
jgi:hypothetical protein